MTARALLCAGYDLRMCDLLSGLPGWADSSRFDVEAKMDADAATAFQKLSENEKLAQLRLMLQELLTDRFRLIAHHSAKDSPVYFLVSTKGGGKLKAAAPVETTLMMVGPAGITATATTIEDLIETLSDNVGRVIVDRTGLNGRYDFVLKTAEDQGAGNADSEPSIFTALQEQLGLKLLPGKAAVDTVVVDHIEKPYTN